MARCCSSQLRNHRPGPSAMFPPAHEESHGNRALQSLTCQEHGSQTLNQWVPFQFQYWNQKTLPNLLIGLGRDNPTATQSVTVTSHMICTHWQTTWSRDRKSSSTSLWARSIPRKVITTGLEGLVAFHSQERVSRSKIQTPLSNSYQINSYQQLSLNALM